MNALLVALGVMILFPAVLRTLGTLLTGAMFAAIWVIVSVLERMP